MGKKKEGVRMDTLRIMLYHEVLTEVQASCRVRLDIRA